MSDVFFTSDTHFGHEKIIELAGRPFQDVDEMTEGLVERWNERIRKQDHVYLIGDVSFFSAAVTLPIITRLRGQIHLIEGNHDDTVRRLNRQHPNLFTSYQQYKEIRVDGQRIAMLHYPMLSWHLAQRGTWHLHGHCHGNLDPAVVNGPMLDVGVDVHDFYPISFEEVRSLLQDKEWVPVDQHRSKEG